MVIPQSMGFALIASIPSIHGLWAACIAHSIYALMVVEILENIPNRY